MPDGYVTGSSGMSYCNQTPFPPCEGWGLGTRLGNNTCVHKQVKACLAIHDLSLAPPLRGKVFKEALCYRKTFDLNTSENF